MNDLRSDGKKLKKFMIKTNQTFIYYLLFMRMRKEKKKEKSELTDLEKLWVQNCKLREKICQLTKERNIYYNSYKKLSLWLYWLRMVVGIIITFAWCVDNDRWLFALWVIWFLFGAVEFYLHKFK